MTAEALVARLRSEGVHLELRGDRLRYIVLRPPLRRETRQELEVRQGEIVEHLLRVQPAPMRFLPPLVRDWPESWREDYEERAAIMEFEGELSRQQAELRAREVVAARFAQHQGEVRDA